jgi:hypothetical protein
MQKRQRQVGEYIYFKRCRKLGQIGRKNIFFKEGPKMAGKNLEKKEWPRGPTILQ